MRFSALGENTAPASADIIPSTDVSDSSTDKKIQLGTLADWMAQNYTAAKLQGALASCDLNDVTDVGAYFLSSANTYVNMPSELTWGLFEVTTSSTANTTVLQTLTGSNGRTFKRWKTSGGWQDWQELTRGNVMTLRGTSSDGSVTFSTAFAATPVVLCTVNNTTVANATVVIVSSSSTTGFSVFRRYYSASDGWLDSATRYDWVAIGTAPSIAVTT